MTLFRLAAVLLASVVVLAACGDDEKSLDPPEINYGVDMSEMGMPVVDPRFTVATMPEGETEWLLFDDIGEFLKYYQNTSDKFEVMWIPNHDTEKWMKAEDVWFVQADEYCYSPMKWCVAAFDSEDAAHEAMTTHNGEMWSWESVFQHDWSSAPVPHEHEENEDHDEHSH